MGPLQWRASWVAWPRAAGAALPTGGHMAGGTRRDGRARRPRRAVRRRYVSTPTPVHVHLATDSPCYRPTHRETGSPSCACDASDGWSTHYRDGNGSTARTTLSHRFVPAVPSSGRAEELRITIHSVRGCLHAVGPNAFDEPGQPRSSGHGSTQPRTRSWRLLLHGVAPPTSGSVRGADGTDTPIHFVDPPTAEMRRRSDDRSEPIWFIDPERLCVVVWLFDHTPTKRAELTLAFEPHTAALATRVALPLLPLRTERPEPAGAIGAVSAMRRAQAAKTLLDATYPETQPQDYDQATWLAGLGTRIAARPSNYSKEMAALPALIRSARAQLVAEPARRVSTPLNSERVRNATALVVEAGVKFA